MKRLLASGLVMGLACTAPEPPDDDGALAAALRHARSVVVDGRMQVSPDPGPDFWGVEERAPALSDTAFIASAARSAGLEFGPDDGALHCENSGRCFGVDGFHGLVHVWDYRRTSASEVVVRLRILAFTADGDGFFEQVDDVYVERPDSTSPWHVARVEQLSIT